MKEQINTNTPFSKNSNSSRFEKGNIIDNKEITDLRHELAEISVEIGKTTGAELKILLKRSADIRLKLEQLINNKTI